MCIRSICSLLVHSSVAHADQLFNSEDIGTGWHWLWQWPSCTTSVSIVQTNRPFQWRTMDFSEAAGTLVPTSLLHGGSRRSREDIGINGRRDRNRESIQATGLVRCHGIVCFAMLKRKVSDVLPRPDRAIDDEQCNISQIIFAFFTITIFFLLNILLCRTKNIQRSGRSVLLFRSATLGLGLLQLSHNQSERFL